MKKLSLFLTMVLVFTLGGCNIFGDQDYLMDNKKMQDININDAVELEVKFNYLYDDGVYTDEFPDIYYYDLEEGWSYIEQTYYYQDGSSLFYYIDNIDGNYYLYEYEDVDYYYMDTPSRTVIDSLYDPDQTDYNDMFHELLDGVVMEEKYGLEYYSKDYVIEDLGEDFIYSLLYILPVEAYGETVTVEMFCHPTSMYCDYRVDLTNTNEYMLTGDFDQVQFYLDITHTFYTEDNLDKDDIFPIEYIEDDYPNTLSTLMMSGNRVYSQHFEGTIDFIWDGDCFEFTVDETALYTFFLNTDHLNDNDLYILIYDEDGFINLGDVVDNNYSSEGTTLEADKSYYLVVSSYHELEYLEYDFNIIKINEVE